ncbi:MAG: hypothetical protein FWF09_03125, partial [Bacteroidales bacterium]|nr:hypothetical protein [Bacteroidales bacterium]
MRNFFMIFVAVFLLGGVSVKAQSTDGTDFWLTFGINNGLTSGGSVTLQIRVVSRDLPTKGMIYFNQVSPVIPPIPFEMEPRTVKTITLDEFGGTAQRSAVYNTVAGTSSKSIYIKSDQPITAYAINQASTSTDATNLLPESALDTSYYHISYNPLLFPETQRQDAYAVIATTDGTIVKHEGTVVATLNKGGVYFRRGGNADMTGSHITSNKPIAYFVVHERTMIPQGVTARDNLFQQLAPVNTWGNNFFAPVSHMGIDRVRIVASQPDTEITLSGGEHKYAPGGQTGPTYTLKPGVGQYIEIETTVATNGCYIQSDKPIGVGTYLTGSEHVGSPVSDPALCWLPSIEQTAKRALIAQFFLPKGQTSHPDPEHYALIVTPDATKENTTVTIGSGTPQGLSGGIWRTHPNPLPGMERMAFYTYKLNSATDSYIFENQGGLFVMGYGVAFAESYYYLGYSSMRNLAAAIYADEIHYADWEDHLFCKNEIEISAKIENLNEAPGSLKWTVNGVPRPLLTDVPVWTETFSAGNHTIKIDVIYAEGTIDAYEGTFSVGAIITTTPSPDEGTNQTYGDGCYKVGKDGDKVTLLAVPGPDYKFVEWTDGTGWSDTNETYSFIATADRDFTGHFELNAVEIIVEAYPPDGGEVSGGGEYNIGATAIVIAKAGECYEFIKWIFEDGTTASTDAEYSFPVTEALTLTAIFKKIPYTITVVESINGSIEPDGQPGGIIGVECGDELTFVFTPDKCYQIAEVLIDDVNDPDAVIAGKYTFKYITDNHTIEVTFEKIPYTITAAATNGTITPDGAQTVDCGDDLTFTFPPADCYQIVEVLIDGIPNPTAKDDEEYTFEEVADDHTIHVTFEKIPYTITATTSEGGSISPSGAVGVKCGENQIFTFEAAACYQIVEVLIDGIPNPTAK